MFGRSLGVGDGRASTLMGARGSASRSSNLNLDFRRGSNMNVRTSSPGSASSSRCHTPEARMLPQQDHSYGAERRRSSFMPSANQTLEDSRKVSLMSRQGAGETRLSVVGPMSERRLSFLNREVLSEKTQSPKSTMHSSKMGIAAMGNRASTMARRRSSSGTNLAMPGLGVQRPSTLGGPVGGAHRASTMSASGQRASFLGPAQPGGGLGQQRPSVMGPAGHRPSFLGGAPRPSAMGQGVYHANNTQSLGLDPVALRQQNQRPSTFGISNDSPRGTDSQGASPQSSPKNRRSSGTNVRVTSSLTPRPQLGIDPTVDEIVYDMSIIPWPTRAARLAIPSSLVEFFPKADAGDPLGDQLTTKSKGAVFGEWALIRDDKRTASVRTTEETELLVVTKAVYQSLCHKDRSEVAEIGQAVDALRLASKSRTEGDLASIDRVLNKNRFFQTVPEKARMELCKVSSLIEVEL